MIPFAIFTDSLSGFGSSTTLKQRLDALYGDILDVRQFQHNGACAATGGSVQLLPLVQTEIRSFFAEYPDAPLKIVNLMVTINNLGSGHSAQQSFNELQQVVDALHDEGAFVLGNTLFATPLPGYQLYPQLNELIVNDLVVDRLVRNDLNPILGDRSKCGNTTYFNDKLHLASKGMEQWAVEIGKVLATIPDLPLKAQFFVEAVTDEPVNVVDLSLNSDSSTWIRNGSQITLTAVKGEQSASVTHPVQLAGIYPKQIQKDTIGQLLTEWTNTTFQKVSGASVVNPDGSVNASVLETIEVIARRPFSPLDIALMDIGDKVVLKGSDVNKPTQHEFGNRQVTGALIVLDGNPQQNVTLGGQMFIELFSGDVSIEVIQGVERKAFKYKNGALEHIYEPSTDEAADTPYKYSGTATDIWFETSRIEDRFCYRETVEVVGQVTEPPPIIPPVDPPPADPPPVEPPPVEPPPTEPPVENPPEPPTLPEISGVYIVVRYADGREQEKQIG